METGKEEVGLLETGPEDVGARVVAVESVGDELTGFWDEGAAVARALVGEVVGL